MAPILLAALILQSTGAAPPQRARAVMESLFLPGDYPVSSLRNNEQGTTAFALTVGPDGRVIDCTVTSSSGSAALDEAACRVVRERATYAPARDANGRPVAGRDSGQVTWRIPGE